MTQDSFDEKSASGGNRRRKDFTQNYPFKPTCRIEDENLAFGNLIFANLSNDYTFMMKEQLRKEDWKIKVSQGLKNASFKKNLAPNIGPKMFSSSYHGGASNENGEWYHMDLRRAKASAFVEFLKYCMHIGFALSLRERIDGSKLPYARA